MARKRKAPTSVVKVTRKKPKKRAPKKNAALVGNPGGIEALWDLALPGAVAYGGTRIIGRVAFKLGKQKSKTLGTHIGPWASVGAAVAIWYATSKIDKFKKFHDAAVVGAFIAAVQGLLQTYLPQYGWVLNDYHLDDASPTSALPPAEAPTEVPAGQYLEAGGSNQGIDDTLGGVLNAGETADDLYSGVFER